MPFSWRGTQGGSVIEEHWMEPEGNGIVGSARVVSGGKTRQTEIGLMEEREDGVVLLRLNPRVEIEGKPYYIAMPEITAVHAGSLGKKVATLKRQRGYPPGRPRGDVLVA